MKKLSSTVAALAGILVLAAGCTEPDPEGPAVVSSVAPIVETIDCPVEAARPPDEWPLAIPDPFVVTEYAVAGNTFRALGISNNGEELLVNTVEETLRDYETSEPDGGPSDVIVDFESANATGSLFMSDEDGDGCWDVDLQISYLGEPERSDFVPIDVVPETELESAVESGIDTSLGTGAATTPRGTFPLTVLTCGLSPVSIEASAPQGELVLQEGEEGAVAMLWTYADGSIISDDDANVVVSSDTTGLFVGDGQSQDGPETVLVEITCDSS